MTDVGEHTGGMIALVPARDDARRLHVDGGDDLDELHLTLAYLGDDVRDMDAGARALLMADARALADQHPPVTAHAMAHAVFNPNGGEHDPATVYLLSGDGLAELRDGTAEHSVSEHPTFLPHVTAGYGLDPGRLDYTGPVRFDRLRVVLAGDVTDIPLTGSPADETPGPDPDDTETKVELRDPPQVRPHPYRRDPASGAGNCTCGRDEGHRMHVAGPSVAGVALMAADTGRVLMLQRALDPDGDGDDPAAGTWEFPGGHLEAGDPTDLHGGMREWAEEVGRPVPLGASVAHQWSSPDGIYRGHVLVIPAESMLDLDAPREVDNPDDDSEQVAWWDPADARRNPALRKECRRTPWDALIRAAAEHGQRKSAQASVAQLEAWAGHDQEGHRVDVESKAYVVNQGAPQASQAALAGRDAPASRLGPDGKPKDGKKKRKVASKEGEKRYGLPIGTELGKARDAKAKGAQDDKGAKALYEKLRGTDPREYRKFLDGLKPEDLQKLSALLYSGKSSNPAIVQARIAVAGALKRKGLDVNDHGGLGRRKPGKPAPKGPAASPDPSWLPGEGWQARKARRQKAGLAGPSGSRPPAAKQKRGEGGRTMTLHVYEDGSWQYKGIAPGATVEPEGWVLVMGADVEFKRTTTKPSKTGTAQDAGKTIGKAKGDDGDEYPIRTIGDVATALKKAKNIKDPDRKKEVMAHIRSGANKIKAGHMVPKDDDADKGTGKSSSDGPPQFIKDKMKKKDAYSDMEYGDAAAQAAAIEAKVMSPDPRAAKLREYWAHGEGRKKWRPGSGGDFDRLRRHLRKHVPERMLNGLTANIHKLATGEWPGKNAHGSKSALGDGADGGDLGEVETTIGPAELAESKVLLADSDPLVGGGDHRDPLDENDSVTLALDAYADMAEDVTSDEEYEQALADGIDWDLLADGELAPSDDDPPPSVKQARERVGAGAGEDEGEFDPDAALEALEASAMED